MGLGSKHVYIKKILKLKVPIADYFSFKNESNYIDYPWNDTIMKIISKQNSPYMQKCTLVSS